MANDFPLISSTGLSYRKEQREDGKEVLVYESGTVLDAKTLKLVEQNKDYAFTRDNASDFANGRWEKAREQFEKGAIEQVNGKSPADAQHALGKALMKRAISGDASNSVAAAEKVAQFTGWVREKHENDSPPPGTIRFTATASIQALRAEMAKRYSQDKEQDEPLQE